MDASDSRPAGARGGHAGPAGGAHIVPIPPSLCSFGTIDLDVPAARVTTSAAGPSATTKLRIVYDPTPASYTRVRRGPTRAPIAATAYRTGSSWTAAPARSPSRHASAA